MISMATEQAKTEKSFDIMTATKNTSHQTHDLNGNPRTNENKTYTYDALDRLITISGKDCSIQFQYDYQGRLLVKTNNGAATFYLYDGMKEIGSTDATGTSLELRILNPTYASERGAAVLLEIHQKSYIPIHDLFGNLIELYDLQGQHIESYQYSSYGEGLSSGINPWQYASKRFLQDAELISFGHRFYNPKYGRWLTPDPAGFVDGYNLYSFVANNPLTNFDHYGLSKEKPFEGTREILAPVVHAVGDVAIETGNFCANGAFIIGTPAIWCMNSFQWQGVERDWSAMHRDFTYFHQQWDAGMQQLIPSEERGSYYNWTRSITEAASCGYFVAKAVGSMALQGVNWIATEMEIYRASRGVSILPNSSSSTKITHCGPPQTCSLLKNGRKAIEDFLGGKGKIITNANGDMILMKDNRKIRFDIMGSHGDKPHFHLEKKTSNGKWIDASPKHRYYFKEDNYEVAR